MLSGILLFTVFHLCFIGFFLLLRQNKKSNLWLGLFFLILAAIEFMQLAYQQKWVYDYRYLNNTDYLYSCLLSTTFYLFVCTNLGVFPKRWVLMIEGMVFLACFIHFVWFEINYPSQRDLVLYLDKAYVTLPMEKQLLNLIIFLDMNFILITSFINVNRTKAKIENLSADPQYSNFEWIKSIILIIFIQYNILMPLFLFLPKTDFFQTFSPVFFSFTYLFVFWKAFNKPDLFMPKSIQQNENMDVSTTELKGSDELEDSSLKKLFEEIDELIVSKKLYLNPDFTLDELADNLNVKKSEISKAIHTCSKKNFFTYINSIRIEEAKKLLLDPKTLDLFTMEGIGKTCGFGSRSGFFSTFKKFEGCTPTEFRNKTLIEK